MADDEKSLLGDFLRTFLFPPPRPKPSKFRMRELNEQTREYSVEGIITITIELIPERSEVTFAWVFHREPKRNHGILIDGSNAPISSRLTWRDADRMNELRQEVREGKKSKEEFDREHFLILQMNRMASGKERRKFQPGTWYVRILVEADELDDGFVHTVNLEPVSPGAAARNRGSGLALEDEWEVDLRRIVRSASRFDEAKSEGARLIRAIEARSDLTADEKRVRIRFVENEVERVLLKLHERPF